MHVAVDGPGSSLNARWKTWGWFAALLQWRDRLLGDPNFQRRALRVPVVRWIARRRMRALFDLCSGFVYSQVLLACTRLGLLQILARSPHSAAELAEILQLPRASLERLLEAAESLQLVETRDRGRIGLGTLGVALLGNPSVGMMIEHHSAFYADLSDPLALMRGELDGTELGRFWAYSQTSSPASLGPEQVCDYSRLMAASQQLIAEQVLAAYPLRRHARLLDVGGGEGAFAAAAMRAAPHLSACVFDLPPVCARALARFDREGLGDRAGTCGGDFLNDPLPMGFDLISLVRVLHDQDDEQALELLRSVRRSLGSRGVILIAEPMLDTRGAEPVGAAYFGFYLMAMGQGRARPAAEIRSMLESAGFTAVKSHRTAAPLLVRVLSARPGTDAG